MAEQSLTQASDDSPFRGMAFLVAGLTIFSVQDVIIKLLSGTYPAHEIMFIRGMVAIGPLFVMVWLDGGWPAFKIHRPGPVLLRGVLGFFCYTTYYMALAVLPLADAITLFYSSPLFVTAFSVVFLREVVGLRRWLAVAAGFAGVLVVMRPGAASLDPALIFALLAALSYAVLVLLTRKIGKSEKGSTMSFYAMSVFIVGSAALGLIMGDGRFDSEAHGSAQFLLRAWTLPSWRDFGLIAVCGVIAAFGFVCLTQAYRLAPASTIAPFEYCSLPWAVLWGFMVWHTLPGLQTLFGVMLIVGSGLYIIRRETVRGRRMVLGRPFRPRM